MLKKILNSLPERFKWTLHNVVAHPLSEFLWQLGFEDFSNKIHDSTIPEHDPGAGRG
jgi:hypothetical protein